MQCLLGSIFHRGNSERAHRFSIRFRYANTSKRLRLIASLLECMYGLCLLFWCVPDFLVYTRGFLAFVLRHSSNGENLAAVRVGQQVLQGSHPAPSTSLRRLHDTHLESAHVAVDGLPINGVTILPPRVRPHQQPWLSSSALSPMPICPVLSCEAPEGSQPAFASGDVVDGSFDRISHDWLLAHVPMDRAILQKWLKSGYMEKHVLHETTEGTPQGGIISPALSNCALDGLEPVSYTHLDVYKRQLQGQYIGQRRDRPHPFHLPQ